jgi:hypothetical protein
VDVLIRIFLYLTCIWSTMALFDIGRIFMLPQAMFSERMSLFKSRDAVYLSQSFAQSHIYSVIPHNALVLTATNCPQKFIWFNNILHDSVLVWSIFVPTKNWLLLTAFPWLSSFCLGQWWATRGPPSFAIRLSTEFQEQETKNIKVDE